MHIGTLSNAVIVVSAGSSSVDTTSVSVAGHVWSVVPLMPSACRHLVNHHRGRIFLGIGIPYSSDVISLEEVHRMGTEIASMDSELQFCLLDYRPEFRRRHIDGFGIWQPDCREMAEAADVLREAGLKMVIAQTIFGHIGP